jgi:hypothetical protein
VGNSGTTLLIYTPTANTCGSDSITYSVQDLSGTISNTGTITVNIACVNDIPVANNDSTATGTEDTQISIPVLTNDTDIEDGIPVAIANLTQPSTGATPITFTYQARDSGNALSNIATVTIPGVTCVNDAPVTQSASYTMTGNIVISSGTIDGSGNLIGHVETNNILLTTVIATDVENSPLSFTLATLPSSGTASLSNTGYLTYTPALNFVGSISFTITSDDGAATSSGATMSICVISPNPNIARPSCAPAIPVPTPVINMGPGG